MTIKNKPGQTTLVYSLLVNEIAKFEGMDRGMSKKAYIEALILASARRENIDKAKRLIKEG